MNIRELISYASSIPDVEVSGERLKRVECFSASFDAVRKQSRSLINAFTFHVDATGDEHLVNVIDTVRDNSTYNYNAMVDHLFWSLGAFSGPATGYLVRGLGAATPAPAGAIQVELNVLAKSTMIDRVTAMCGYVHSEAFDKDTVFLDTDAFPNQNLSLVFKDEFDLAFTFRPDLDLMPINEGVIFASCRRKPVVQAFFRDYLSRYETLCADEAVRAYYGDIGKWRGGQLALNATAFAKGWDGMSGAVGTSDMKLSFLPCDPFNYSIPREIEHTLIDDWRFMRDKAVIHLKGGTKRHFAGVSAYQKQQAPRLWGPV